MLKLDLFDKILLTELDKSSAADLGKLAKRIKRSKQFVLYRMKKLEEAGVITGYTAIVDMSRLGYFTFRVYFDLQNITEAQKKEMIGFSMENNSCSAIISEIRTVPMFSRLLPIRIVARRSLGLS